MSTSIDLHIHTTCSDGTFTPKEIVDIAKKNNVKVISITDHDSIKAYNDELFLYAKENGIKLIPGVEISTKYYGIGIHVLGYNFDLNNKELNDCLNRAQNARRDYLINVTQKLNELGYIVNKDKLNELPTVTKAHIAKDVVSNKLNEQLLMKEFNHIPDMGEFIETTMNENCPAYVKKFSITPIEASKIIKSANGKVILAHPVCYVYEDNLEVEKIFELIKLMDIDGIEAHYLFLNKDNINQDDSKFWDDYAKENKLLSTLGSDFHQLDNKHIELGFNNSSFKISSDEENEIIEYITKKV